MGLFSADQLAAIEAGRPVFQEWALGIPESLSHAAYGERIIDSDVNGVKLRRVTNPGRRSFRAVGVNLKDSRKYLSCSYQVECRNDDGLLYPAQPGEESLLNHPSTGYRAHWRECYLTHRVYVVLLSGALDELAFVRYKGWIYDLEYSDAGRLPGEPTGNLATIMTEDAAANEVLRREWTKQDAETTDTGYYITY